MILARDECALKAKNREVDDTRVQGRELWEENSDGKKRVQKGACLRHRPKWRGFVSSDVYVEGH
jgi:hypothetical protein